MICKSDIGHTVIYAFSSNFMSCMFNQLITLATNGTSTLQRPFWTTAAILSRTQCGLQSDLDPGIYKQAKVTYQIYTGRSVSRLLQILVPDILMPEYKSTVLSVSQPKGMHQKISGQCHIPTTLLLGSHACGLSSELGWSNINR